MVDWFGKGMLGFDWLAVEGGKPLLFSELKRKDSRNCWGLKGVSTVGGGWMVAKVAVSGGLVVVETVVGSLECSCGGRNRVGNLSL